MRRLILALSLVLATVLPAQASFYDLLNAARADDTATARALLEAGTEPNGGPSGFPDSYSPLQWAAYNGNLELIRLLLAAGADTERRDFNGDRPLLWAARAGQADSIALLVAHGSPANALDDPYGQSPLHLAARVGFAAAARVLIAAGADLDAVDHSNGTALTEAVLSQDIDVVRLLLVAGADPDIADDILFDTPLHLAAAREEAAIVRLLLVHRAKPGGWNGDGSDPLHVAAFRGLPGNVAVLIEGGADPLALNDAGQTPLLSAIEGKRHEWRDNDAAAALLVPFATDVDAVFRAAASAGMSRTAIGLIERGADLERYGAPALFAAAGTNQILLLTRLLEAGMPMHDGLLLAAGQAGSVDVVRLLLDRGAAPIPPGDIRLAEFTLIESRALQGGQRSAALDTVGMALRQQLADLRGRQQEVRSLLADAIAAR